MAGVVAYGWASVPFFRSRPGNLLLGSTLALIPLTFAIPYLPTAGALGFTPLPLPVLVFLMGITVLYVAAAELAKKGFYRGGQQEAQAR